MEKKLYKVPVTWTMSGTYYIRASSPEEAKEAVFDAELPEGQYLDDSFEIDGDIEEETYYQPPDDKIIESDEEDDDICKDCDSPKRTVMVPDAVGNGLHEETVCDCDTSA